VILVAHSMGGLACRAYLRRHGRGKVGRLITLGSVHCGTRLARLGLGPNARQMQIGNPWLIALGATNAVHLPPGLLQFSVITTTTFFRKRQDRRWRVPRIIAIAGVSHVGMAFSPAILDTLLETLASPAP